MASIVKDKSKWRVRWFDANGVRHSETFDRHDDAKLGKQRRELELEETIRGLRGLAPVNRTVAELCDYWLAKRAPLKRSEEDDKSIIRAHLRPAFGHVRVRDLGAAHFDNFLVARTHLAPQTVAHHLMLLGTMLRLAVDLGWLDRIPRIPKPKIRQVSQEFRYLRTKDEIARFLTAARAQGPDVLALYATAVYTGMRAGELAGLHWDDIDFDKRLITVQRSFDGPTKAGDVRYVPILAPLLPILQAWRLQRPGSLVFVNYADRMLQPKGPHFQEIFHRTLSAAGLPRVMVGAKLRSYIRFHDLRHTFASHWVMGGGDIFKLQKILGHHSTQMTLRYAHLAPTAFADDLDRLGTAAPLGHQAQVINLEQVATA